MALYGADLTMCTPEGWALCSHIGQGNLRTKHLSTCKILGISLEDVWYTNLLPEVPTQLRLLSTFLHLDENIRTNDTAVDQQGRLQVRTCNV